MITERKQPTRKCIACGETKAKRELVRVIRTPEGSIELDLTGRKNGRGAYICNSVACLAKAEKTKAFNRSFSMEVAPEVYELLKKELSTLEN